MLLIVRCLRVPDKMASFFSKQEGMSSLGWLREVGINTLVGWLENVKGCLTDSTVSYFFFPYFHFLSFAPISVLDGALPQSLEVWVQENISLLTSVSILKLGSAMNQNVKILSDTFN